jgi:Escherichia/Staphylococcus phage prohead protease
MAEIERRAFIEVRAMGRRLHGLAAPFNVEAHIGGFRERILPGAFAETLADGHDVLALVDHDPTRLLGRTKTGSLRLEETRSGLEFELDVPDTSLGHDVLSLAQRGDLGGMSFSFRIRNAGERWDGTLRELRSVDLMEVSVIHSWPAYDSTEVFARSKTPPRLARALRVLETV